MKRAIAMGAGLCLSILGLVGLPGNASSDTPDPASHTFHEFTFEDLSVFDGRSYVPGWEKIRIAVPNLVRCERQPSSFSDNCSLWISASAETSLSQTVSGPIYQLTRFEAYVFVPGSTTPWRNGGTTVLPFWQAGAPIGTGWNGAPLNFSLKENGTITLRVKQSVSDAEYVAGVDIQIPVSVKSQAEIDAEDAERERASRAAADAAAKAEAKRVAKILGTKLSITCKSGSKTRKVSGDPPACPKGFKNPMASEVTFQAYSKCKLYKKTSGFARAKLQDSGKTLNIDGFGRGYSSTDLNRSDWACLTKTMKVPSSVLNKIGQTRAIDGMVSARFGRIEAFWTYHPDDGLDITFSR